MKQWPVRIVAVSMFTRKWLWFWLCSGASALALAQPPDGAVSAPTEIALSVVSARPEAPAADAETRALFVDMEHTGITDPAPPATPSRIAPRESVLGLAPAPPTPAPRQAFDLPPGDAAAMPARTIARRVAQFQNLRAKVPGAVWSEDERARFAIRSQAVCLHELAQLGVRAHLVTRPLTTPVPTPVALDGPIEGVTFASLHLDREVEVSCELATRLPALARLLRELGVRAVGINSSYRDAPKVSFHTFGLALDMAAFRRNGRTLIVAQHFEVTPDARTCEAQPSTEDGRAILEIACALAQSQLFSSVLTPNYNEGHRDHFHVDMRPDDPRLFVR